jgi:hypothetical protein
VAGQLGDLTTLNIYCSWLAGAGFMIIAYPILGMATALQKTATVTSFTRPAK